MTEQLCHQSSRATVVAQASVARPSIVRKLRFLRNRSMNPGQALWATPYPQYLHTIILFFFQNLLSFFFKCFRMGSFSLTWDHTGMEISKRYSSYSFYLI